MSACVAGMQYLPSIEYFAHWKYHGKLIIEKHEHYQKRTWRNKTAILGSQDPLLLSVPLRKGKNQEKPITEVEISYDQPWPQIHLGSIKAAYGKTAFFSELESDIDTIYKNRHQFLWDLNMQFIQLVISFFPGEWNVEYNLSYEVKFNSDVIDIRKGIPAGQSALSKDLVPVYDQIHRFSKSHLPNLSILDVLCHLGPGAIDYLEQYAKALYT
ncbi:MAG: WbqC family protein [Saprospiraceae bacterium]